MKTTIKISWFVCLIALFSVSCQKEEVKKNPVQITLVNPGFEDTLRGWDILSTYAGGAGFTATKLAARSGNLGLNFYAAQANHYPGAPQETPWNGLIYQTISGLKDGKYTYKVYADAVGEGMYIWATGGEEDVKIPIKSSVNELNTLEFSVKGGIAKIGLLCVDANGAATFAPYFHADDLELWEN